MWPLGLLLIVNFNSCGTDVKIIDCLQLKSLKVVLFHPFMSEFIFHQE
jgi:hypothetical protein